MEIEHYIILGYDAVLIGNYRLIKLFLYMTPIDW